jgi:hypothetical protein
VNQDDITREFQRIHGRFDRLEDKLEKKLEPIEQHVTKVRFLGGILIILFPVLLALLKHYI